MYGCTESTDTSQYIVINFPWVSLTSDHETFLKTSHLCHEFVQFLNLIEIM